MKIAKNILRNVLIMGLSGTACAATLYMVASAAGSSAASASSTEKQLTSEEIDKIIQDLKLTTNIDNVLEKLAEIIQRAELSGNDALKEYATNTKTAYELQKQLDTINSLIEAMKQKNADINTLDQTLKKILSVTTIIEDLQGAVSDEALLALESLTDSNVKDLQEVLAEIEEIVDLNDVKSLSLKERSLLDILMLNEAISKDMFEGDRLQVAREAQAIAVTVLKSYEKQRYGSSEYEDLVSKSEEFANKGKKSETVFPEQVIFFSGAFNMQYAPIMYDGHILLAVNDLFQYIDSTIEYMYNSPTMVIQSKGKILEITSGKNVAYLNDQPVNMKVPVLNINDTIYISGEFFAQAYGVSYKYVEDQELLVFYHNLNQLKNPAVPNQINRD
ncbi:MAG: copper amine oxidase N-terminal domain-containing protein [Oscillospiraceae bacterium]|jgi:hypothetical protein|nr:copper amine oxidase N-terminal domain-containing protein [Oscillospiraceae bacterium]